MTTDEEFTQSPVEVARFEFRAIRRSTALDVTARLHAGDVFRAHRPKLGYE